MRTGFVKSLRTARLTTSYGAWKAVALAPRPACRKYHGASDGARPNLSTPSREPAIARGIESTTDPSSTSCVRCQSWLVLAGLEVGGVAQPPPYPSRTALGRASS